MSDYFLYKMNRAKTDTDGAEYDSSDDYWILFESGILRHPIVILKDYQMVDIVRQYNEQKENKKNPKKGRE